MAVFVFGSPEMPVRYSPTFADNGWETIIKACQENQVPDTWLVGDSKTMTIGDAEYQIDIIGKSHDVYSDGTGTAPLTFQLRACYAVKYRMNSENSSTGGWTACEMRQTTLPAILALMPIEISGAVREIKKLTSAGNRDQTVHATADKLFLLSEKEVFGAVSYSFTGEGSQYAYYQKNNLRVKSFNGTADNWLLRSPHTGNAVFYCCVAPDGSPSYGATNYPIGVAFAFCF